MSRKGDRIAAEMRARQAAWQQEAQSSNDITKPSSSGFAVPTTAPHAVGQSSEFLSGNAVTASKLANRLRQSCSPPPEGMSCEQCKQGYSQESVPMLLNPCGHSFCRRCVEDLFKTKGVKCPNCKGVIQSAVPNRALSKLVEHNSLMNGDGVPPLSSAEENLDSATALQEGPLPPELLSHLREVPHSSDVKIQAETYLRRLLARQRRLRIHKEELLTSRAEDIDIQACLKQAELVTSALSREASNLDERIAALQRERLLCQHQLEDSLHSQEQLRERQKASGCRTAALHTVTENLKSEIQRGLMIVHQLVPSLRTDPLLQPPE